MISLLIVVLGSDYTSVLAVSNTPSSNVKYQLNLSLFVFYHTFCTELKFESGYNFLTGLICLVFNAPWRSYGFIRGGSWTGDKWFKCGGKQQWQTVSGVRPSIGEQRKLLLFLYFFTFEIHLVSQREGVIWRRIHPLNPPSPPSPWLLH